MRRLLIIASLSLTGLVCPAQYRATAAAGSYEFQPVPVANPPAKPAFPTAPAGPSAPAIADPAAQPPDSAAPAPSSNADTSTGYQTDDKHKLLSGDRVSFRILEDRIFESRETKTTPAPPPFLTVTDSGELDVPYIGLVSVAGKTCREATKDIKARLERDYYYVATVVMGLDQAAKAIGRIYISGQVRRQGAIEIPANETFTASKAILRADGFGDFADKKRVKVIRTQPDGGKKTFTLNMVDILEKGKTENDLPLLPDDYILVPARIFNY